MACHCSREGLLYQDIESGRSEQSSENCKDSGRRKSTRIRYQPDRLNVKSWGTQSYEADAVCSGNSWIWQQAGDESRQTVQSSTNSLHPDVTGGEGGHRWVYPAYPKPNLSSLDRHGRP